MHRATLGKLMVVVVLVIETKAEAVPDLFYALRSASSSMNAGATEASATVTLC